MIVMAVVTTPVPLSETTSVACAGSFVVKAIVALAAPTVVGA